MILFLKLLHAVKFEFHYLDAILFWIFSLSMGTTLDTLIKVIRLISMLMFLQVASGFWI